MLALLVILYKKGYFKRAPKRAARDGGTEAVYEEVGDVIVESKSEFTIDVNACYSLKRDPVYAEIEDGIQTKLNDAYASTLTHTSKQKTLHSSIPPQQRAGMPQCLSSDATVNSAI